MLAKGQIDEVIKDLGEYIKAEKIDHFDELILINSNLSRLKLELGVGLISKEHEVSTKQNIISALLHFINQRV